MAKDNVWTYRPTVVERDLDIDGYDVEASDGHIGKVDRCSWETGTACIVVDTGFWIFGKKRLIAAGAVQAIDRPNRSVSVGMTKAEVEAGPDFDETSWDAKTPAWLSVHGDYYAPYGW